MYIYNLLNIVVSFQCIDAGLIEEYGPPARLLENKSSSFAQLVAEYTVRSGTSFENLADN